MITKRPPKFKKGPVSAEIIAKIEKDHLEGATTEQLSERYERSPAVIEKTLARLAERPKPVARVTRAVLEFDYRPLSIKTPNGCEFELTIPVGMDATSNTVMLEQIQHFVDTHKGETAAQDRLQQGEY